MSLNRTFPVLIVLLLATLLAPAALAEPRANIERRFSHEEGTDAPQAGCTTFDYEANPCHQIATSMNGLDTPKIDVLILVPVGPFAERDMRIMRQSVEMWADGVQWLAGDMGLHWMVEGVEFHIFMEMLNVLGPSEAEFTTYPIIDPEIVVVATNPVGGIGIGIDPLDFAGQLFGEGAGQGPCHGVQNPFDLALWEVLPGFDSHHGGRSGTYVEDCGGAGGNICFSVNGAIDPATDLIDIFQLYDLVSHETGHCLSLGHVGDGAEGDWSSVPTNDIMAYHADPPGLSKCVSSLNVEALAVVMSRYLDVNGDGIVNGDDYLYANDVISEGDGRPFQIQHPDNHYYASPTRQAIDCPQPDMGLVPLSEVVNFTPTALPRPELAIVGKEELQPVAQGVVNVRGTTNGTAAGTSVILSVLAAPVINGSVPELGVANVTVPLRTDGTWSGNLEFTSVADQQAIVVSARWLDADGNLLDADRVTLLVVAGAPVDRAAVATADAGPRAGSASSEAAEGAPALGFVVLAFAVLAAAFTRRT